MDEHRNKLLLLRTPVAIIPHDWSDLIDRRAVFRPDYGIVIGYSQKRITREDDGIGESETIVEAIDVQLKNGNIMSIAGFELDGMGVFDAEGFVGLMSEEIEKTEGKIKELRGDIERASGPVEKIPEINAPVKEFWIAQLASWKQSVKFLNKKNGKLEDLGKKVERKLDKLAGKIFFQKLFFFYSY